MTGCSMFKVGWLGLLLVQATRMCERTEGALPFFKRNQIFGIQPYFRVSVSDFRKGGNGPPPYGGGLEGGLYRAWRMMHSRGFMNDKAHKNDVPKT